MEIALAEGEPGSDLGPVAHVDVADVKAEAERLRGDGVEVGVVFELHGEIRLLDVFDPDGTDPARRGRLAVIRRGAASDVPLCETCSRTRTTGAVWGRRRSRTSRRRAT